MQDTLFRIAVVYCAKANNCRTNLLSGKRLKNQFRNIFIAIAFLLLAVQSAETSPPTTDGGDIMYMHPYFYITTSGYLYYHPHLLYLLGMQIDYDDLDELLFTKDSSRYQPFFLKRPEIWRETPDGHSFGKRNEKNPEGYYQYRDIDSAVGNMMVYELFEDVELGYPYPMTVDDYLRYRKTEIQKRVWDSLLTRYDLKKGLSGGDLYRLLSQATGLTIPLPPNPVIGIFGKPEISINVNGEVNLRLGWRWDFQNLGTVSAFGQTQSSPIFNQDIRVNVSAKIGDKLKFGTDWNTRRTFDYDNKFKIAYVGETDDIVKRVEVGNVSLDLNSALIGGGQALFGVRSDYQFGPLFIKTIFSQRRGQRKSVDVRGGLSKTPFYIRAYDYAQNHFFIDEAYKAVYNEYFSQSTPVIPRNASHLRVKEFEVWEATNNIQDVHSASSIAIADLEGIDPPQSYPDSLKNLQTLDGYVQRGRFVRLDTNSYRLDRNLGTLTIHNLRRDRYYAICYRVEGPTDSPDDDIYYGTFSYQSDPQKQGLILKLLYRPNIQPAFKTLWSRQMKNIYSINATQVKAEETDLNIWYIRQTNDSTDILEGAPDKLVTILNVDQVNNSTGSAPPDGKFDLRQPFFNAYRGEITFPHVEPFGDGLREYFKDIGNPELAEQYTFDEVYDTTNDIARRNTARDRFVITGEVSGRATNRISLGAFNLAPNSVKVTLDGVALREFDDYVVDYYAGILTLRNQRAMMPNANLNIEYEQHDIFNISTRTLAGIRLDYLLFDSRRAVANIGATLMHYDQSAIIDRVRLGEEPVSNTMIGFDAQFNLEAPWLTKALDLLPFYDTKEMSTLNVKAETAVILPNPNKRESEVKSDNHEPVVYIDDFEGAQRYISLGLVPTQWQHSSQPADSSIAPTDEERALYRGKMFWYQYFIPHVDIRDVYPKNESYQQGKTRLNPLYINFNPYIRGIYNKNPEFLDERNPTFNEGDPRFADQIGSDGIRNKEKIWGGMQRVFSSFNTNFDKENIEFIEIMMNVLAWEPGQTKFYIDIGQISEDIIPNGQLNTEDGITDENPMPNGIIDIGEDVGIDSLNNELEKEIYPYPLNEEDDPARDDYYFNFGMQDENRTEEDFFNYNNFEGNSTSELGQFPDQEVLNSNNGLTLTTSNSYFTYDVNLEPDPNLNSQIVGGNPDKGWYLYRLPIRKPNDRTGNPSFSMIQYVRLRVQGGLFKARVADWRLVGSHWQRISNFQSNFNPNDSVLQLAFVNLWENSGPPDYYTMPPGVYAPRQLNNPDPTKDIRLNEQSLSVCVRNMRWGDERMAVRNFHPLDLFYYKKLKFFIHGDGSMPNDILPGGKPKAYAFLRFGTDSMNYYEYRRPLIRGWQDIQINLEQLTAIKQIRDTSLKYDRQVFPIEGDEEGYFAIKGHPILTRVVFFGVGIANPSDAFQELSTCMWIDELRLLSPERSADWGGVGSVDLKLADLGTVNATIQTLQPNFHKIEERFGTRESTTNWTVSMQGNLEKFAPKSFQGMKLPISYTHSERMRDPQFEANTDVNINTAAERASLQAYEEAVQLGLTETEARQRADAAGQALRKRSQTLNIQDSWALTGVKLGIPIKHWSIENTLNALTLGYSYSQEFERSPVYAEKFRWMWKLNVGYNISIGNFLEFQPLTWIGDAFFFGAYSDWKVNFLPSNITLGLDMARQRQTEQSRYLRYPSPVIRDFTAVRSGSFSWKFSEGGFINPLIDYNFSTNSTLVEYELDANGRQRTGSELADVILFNNGLLKFGQNNQHNQTITLNIEPRLPNIGGIHNYFDISGSFTTTYTWFNPLQPDPEIRDIAKNANYNNSIRLKADFRLKALADNWWGMESKKKLRGRIKRSVTDTTKKEEPKVQKTFIQHVGIVFKTIFLDWENIKFTLNQQTSSVNPGVYGNTGFENFWTRGVIGQNSLDNLGPSWAYQMGLIEHPHGGFNFTSSNSFPWIGIDRSIGLRPPNATLQDNFNQKTTLSINTSRPLWEGAVLDLEWKSDYGYNRNQTVDTDENGVPKFSNILAIESYNRTFLTWPDIFGWNLFNNTITHVVELYREREANILQSDADTVKKNQLMQDALSTSFYEGLRAFELFSGSAGKFLPAMNWTIRWEGIEEWEIWKEYAKRVNIEHGYKSSYQENAQQSDIGRVVQNQIIEYGFQPLFGINATLKEEPFDGLITAQFRISNTKNYQLNSAARTTISSTATTEITAQAAYKMNGFEFKFFGINLENDVELSWLFTFKDNQRETYDVLDPTSYEDGSGRKLDGNKQIIIEPRARYAISNRLSASFFVRYEGTFTEGAAQPGFHSTQVGLDIRLSVAGGR